MKLVVTIFEPTLDGALDAIRALDRDHDMIEMRVDAFSGGDLDRFREVTSKPIIFTNRGGEPVETDFGLIDVEFGRHVRHPERTVLSHHDFDGVPDLDHGQMMMGDFFEANIGDFYPGPAPWIARSEAVFRNAATRRDILSRPVHFWRYDAEARRFLPLDRSRWIAAHPEAR